MGGAPHRHLLFDALGFQIHNGDLVDPTRGDPEILAIFGDLHTIRTAGYGKRINNLQEMIIDQRNRIGHAIGNQDVLPIAAWEEVVRSLASDQTVNDPMTTV